MGLITGLLTLPLAPVRGVVWVAEQLQRVVDQELGEEGTRRQLAELRMSFEAGEISAEDYAAAEALLVDRLLRISEGQEGRTHG
jgi:Gas vesicle protein G